MFWKLALDQSKVELGWPSSVFLSKTNNTTLTGHDQ